MTTAPEAALLEALAAELARLTPTDQAAALDSMRAQTESIRRHLDSLTPQERARALHIISAEQQHLAADLASLPPNTPNWCAMTARSGQQLTLADLDQAPTDAPVPRRRAADRPAMSETQLLAAVRHIARLHQWLCYHTADSRRSEAGWPDLAMVSVRQRRLLVVELKTEDGRVSPEQRQWLGALAACGIEVAIWRPSDLVDVAAILAGRRLDPAEYGIEPLTPDRLRWRR